MPLDELLARHEPAIRLGMFFGVLALMALWEVLAPRRALTLGRARRWPSNLAITVLNTVLVRVLFPFATVGVAAYGSARGIGLFNVLDAPAWLALAASVLVLDLAIYGQHVAFHRIPWAWRLHRMHHADRDIDVTTGARFHPIEIVLSMLIKFAVVLAIGAPAAAVVVFEVLLNATSMFNHANVRLPLALDRWLRLVLVTPDMHRVHHSEERDETDSNFGFNLPWWDRLFGTYRAQPRRGHQAMTIGLREWRDPRQCARLPGMLAIPFTRGRPAPGT